jgi:hypothetical protein
MTFSLEVEEKDLINSLSISKENHGEIINFILNIDMEVGDSDFTEKLVKTLLTSLKNDVDLDNRAKFLRELDAIYR